MAPVAPGYKINNVNIPSPSTGQWIIPDVRGIDGSGQKRYDPYYQFNMSWNLMTQADYFSIYNLWLGTYGSGTFSATIPMLGSGSYTFGTYSGVIIDQPEIKGSFESNYQTSVSLTIRRIRI